MYVLSKLIIYYPLISPPSIVITILGVPWLKDYLVDVVTTLYHNQKPCLLIGCCWMIFEAQCWNILLLIFPYHPTKLCYVSWKGKISAQPHTYIIIHASKNGFVFVNNACISIIDVWGCLQIFPLKIFCLSVARDCGKRLCGNYVMICECTNYM